MNKEDIRKINFKMFREPYMINLSLRFMGTLWVRRRKNIKVGTNSSIGITHYL